MPNTITPYLSETSILHYFLRAHAHNPGQTPKSFYLWSMISCIAAIVQDKFYFEKFQGHAMLGNLYVILVAPSGVGKGTAINTATDYLRPYKEELRMFVGRTTHSKWMEFVTTPRGRVIPIDAGPISDPRNNGACSTAIGYLVHEELAWCVGDGQRAQEFVRMMTAVYSQTGREFEEATQMFGHHNMCNPCFNWLAGTTGDWLLDSIGVKNLLSGFASRIVWLIEDYDISRMASWPTYPQDFRIIQEYLKYRIHELICDPGGEVYLAPGARFELDKWYANWLQRANDTDKGGDRALLPLYSRGHDMALKLAILIRAADIRPDDPNRQVIRTEEIWTATGLVEKLMLQHYPRLVRLAYKSEDPVIQGIDKVAELIQSLPIGEATRTRLTKKGHNKGINAKVVDAALGALMEREVVERIPGPGGRGGYFRWIGE